MRLVRLILRLRFRILLSTLRQRGGRDGFESISRALGVVVPALVALGLSLLVLGAGIAGGLAADVLIRHPGSTRIMALVFALGLLLPFLLSVTGPLFGSDTGRGIEGSVFLRTQPIPARTLHGLRLLDGLLHGQVVAALVGVGAATAVFAAVAPGAVAAVAAAGAGLLVLLLVAATSVAELAAELLVRRRRLSGWVRILGIVGLLLTFVCLPLLAPLVGRQLAVGRVLPWVVVLDPGATWVTAVVAAEGHHLALASVLVGLLAVLAMAALSASARLHRRIAESPPPSRRGRGAGRGVRRRTIPLCRPGTAAVARAHLRLVLRSTRGRMSLIGPALGATILAIVGRLAPAGSGTPVLFVAPVFIAGLVIAGSLGNLSAITGNQLAAHGAGLVLERLQPLADTTLLRGRAVGGFLAYLLAVALGLGLTFPILRPPPWMWAGAGLAAITVYAALAPVQAVLSALFPVTTKLTTMSRKAGPHPLVRYGLLALGGMATGALVLLAWGGRALGGPILALGLLGIAAAVAAAASGPLIDLAAGTVAARMDNALAVATGR